MKGNGNGLSTLVQKLYFYMIPTQAGRTKYILNHKHMFKSVGKNFFFQPRKFPADPERIAFGNNVKISAGVIFINHDITHFMLNAKYGAGTFEQNRGCIQIGDNVMIGANVMILPDVKIGNNVIVGAGAIVTKDIPDDSVCAGIPCKVIGKFDDFVEKRRNIEVYDNAEMYWERFEKEKGQ